MTLVVNVSYTHGDAHFTDNVSSGDDHPAFDAIRFAFNPSGLANVTSLKALAAAFLIKCDEIALANPEAGRELAVAKTNMQTASMWAVLGATKGAK